MMKKLRIWAARLLVLQLVIATLLYLGSIESGADFKTSNLLAFNKNTVDKLVIISDKDKVTLTKDQGNWHLPDVDGLPVKSERLTAILDKLAALKSTRPVTTTSNSHQRFEVAEDKFQRKIQIYDHDKLVGEFYLGNSPGFKKNYLRIPASDNVYALAINIYDFPVNVTDWIDKQLLVAKNIQVINGPDFKLTKSGKQWQLSQPEKQQTASLDESNVNKYIKALETFNIIKIAEEKPDFTSEKTISVQVQGDKNLTYQFTELKGKFYVKRSDNETIFSLSPYEYQRLTNVDFSKLSLNETEKSSTVASQDNVSPKDKTNDNVNDNPQS